MSTEQIMKLREEAKRYHDRALVKVCNRALKGDEEALDICEEVILAAVDLHDDEADWEWYSEAPI